jgi:hypothetical protein
MGPDFFAITYRVLPPPVDSHDDYSEGLSGREGRIMTMREVGGVVVTILFLPVYAVVGVYFLMIGMVEKRRMARKQLRKP